MQTYTTSQASQKLGKLLREAQWGEVPFMLRVRQEELAIAAPFRWFERACRTTGEEPELTPAASTFRQVRYDLVTMAGRAAGGEFILITRAVGPACVLVAIPWYNGAVTQSGPPAGDPPDRDGDNPAA